MYVFLSSRVFLRSFFSLCGSLPPGSRPGWCPHVWPTRRSNKNASQKAGLDTHKSLKTRLHFSCPESSNIIGKKEKWGQREEKELQRAETELQFCGCAHCRRLSFPSLHAIPSFEKGRAHQNTKSTLAFVALRTAHTHRQIFTSLTPKMVFQKGKSNESQS